MKKYLKIDAVTVIILFFMTIVLCTGMLDRGHVWGDDFSAYLLQAQAMHHGTMDEQAKINRLIHASEMTFGEHEDPEELVYVWGYPLVLSWIYGATGFDMEAGCMPIAYKIPGVIALGLFVVAAFSFYRRRFSYGVSLFLSALFMFNAGLIEETNCLVTDVFGLTMSMASLLLIEVFLDCSKPKYKIMLGVLLGVVLWYTYEVRLNGVTIIYIVLAAHVLHLVKNKPAVGELPRHVVPYLILLVLLGISMCIYPSATSNSSHIGSGPTNAIFFNFRWYSDEIEAWIKSMVPEFMPLRDYAHYLVYGLILIGVFYSGIRKNLHLTTFIVGTFAVLLLLPYAQRLRYLYNVLPFLLLFAVHGAEEIWNRMKCLIPKGVKHAVQVTGYAVMLVIVFCMAENVIQNIEHHKELGGADYRYEAYSDEARDIYAYIRQNTPEDAMIGSLKPRALLLNTGRIGFIPGINGNRYKNMDYMLSFTDKTLYDQVTESIWPELWNELTEVYRNDKFVLYEMSEAYKLSE